MRPCSLCTVHTFKYLHVAEQSSGILPLLKQGPK